MSDVAMLTPDALRQAQTEGAQVVDLRPGSIYAREHIPESVNLPYSRNGFAEAAAYFLRSEAPVVLVTDSAPIADAAKSALLEKGFNVHGHLEGGMSAWKQTGGATTKIAEVTADQLAADLKSETPPRLIDVREEWEFAARHIEGAELWPLSTFGRRVQELPRDERLVLVCASGARSAEAVHFLYRLGHRNVENLVGGMGAWMAGQRRA